VGHNKRKERDYRYLITADEEEGIRLIFVVARNVSAIFLSLSLPEFCDTAKVKG